VAPKGFGQTLSRLAQLAQPLGRVVEGLLGRPARSVGLAASHHMFAVCRRLP